jgi:hemerythrin-like metal-binding protein
MLPYMEWRPAYSVGNASIDNQHKQIIEIINDLYSAMQAGEDADIVKPLLERLLAYTDMHFEFEEQVMEECGYPHLDEHRHLHDQLRHRTDDLRNHVGLVTGSDLLHFLAEWWADHIQAADKQYAPYVAASLTPD